jgi:TPP-dependent pyruvate/acetoin dehydrogenase alpha subunit
MNLAALWQLPILFVCENNRYGMGTALEYAESETNLARKAAAYKMEARQVDGMNVLEVAESAEAAAEEIRSGMGPVFLECLTYRFRAHSMFDAELYRDKEEVVQWKKKGPLVMFRKQLEEAGFWDQIDDMAIEKEVDDIVSDAVEFAENGTLEPIEELEKYVYSEEVSHG